MSQTTCPSGHVSADPEWCDTCGVRLGVVPDTGSASGGAAPAGDQGAPFAGPPSGVPVPGFDSAPCPHCGAANESDALFCEECGYDFTTGQPPEPVPTATVPAISATAASATAPPSAPVAVGGADLPQADAAPAPTGWIVIVEVDPNWFELKGTLADRPCPSPSTSTIPLHQAVVHIGRSSQSRGIRPEVSMDSDTAVSRRHAQLIATVTGATGGAPGEDAAGAGEPAPDAYAVLDLGSTNGTFVVRAGSEPAESIEPIAPGVSITLADGDRVYIGAWSRLTIRHTGV